MMVIHTVSEAKAQLSKLLAKVESGEEIVIGRNGRPIAKLVPFETAKKPRTPNVLKGKFSIADDFDVLPDDIARAFGMID
jgi:prevent-host-death family protein